MVLWDLQKECVSFVPTSFNVGIFSLVLCAGVTELVPDFLSERIAPCINVLSDVSVGGWKFRSLLYFHLGSRLHKLRF